MKPTFSVEKIDDISIVVCGAAGQGIATVERILTRVMKSAGYNVFATREYMSRVRGGTNSTEIRIASTRKCAYFDRMDIFIPLHQTAIPRQRYRITQDTIFIGEKENMQEVLDSPDYKVIALPFTELAKEIGSKIYANIISAGMILSLFNVDISIVEDFLTKNFASKGEKILQNNLTAARKGYELADELKKSGTLTIKMQKNIKVKDELFLDGTDAVALGAIAGGCNFASGYPMSPSTGVLRFMANNSVDFDIVVEQCEDEISVINSSIGAWYAGARGIISTSGGGFALMSEALSLAGQTETPLVIHLASRPGPATGLPTRTIQSDLFLALHSGHGFFPRIILAPGTVEDAFFLTQSAFNWADKFQVPVIILTDQYFVNTYYNISQIDTTGLAIENHIIRTEKDYKRYKLTESGISPRGIPGHGEGLVGIDSHAHDEEAHVSEDLHHIRMKMVEKRLKKLALLKKEVVTPELVGSKNYEILLIGWGSTYYTIREALKILDRDEIAFLHYKQVYPIHPETANYLKKAKTTIMIECNVTSQFSKLILQETGIDTDHKVLKYNGLPFSVEEIVEKVRAIIKGGGL